VKFVSMVGCLLLLVGFSQAATQPTAAQPSASQHNVSQPSVPQARINQPSAIVPLVMQPAASWSGPAPVALPPIHNTIQPNAPALPMLSPPSVATACGCGQRKQ
jgi:hypothetical protein